MADTQTQLAVLSNNLGLTAAQLSQLSTNLQTFKDQALLALDDDVARSEDGSRITRKGFELLGKALAGKELKFTRAVVGDSEINGQLTLPTDEEIFELTELVNYRFEVALGKVTHTGAGTAAVSFELKNTENTTPIWTREFGIMAEDPDTGAEILYCYRNDGILSQCMPTNRGKTVWDIIITVYTIVAEATNITAVIDGSMNYVTPHEFDEHINSTRPHPNTPYLAARVTTTPDLWVTGSDSNLHPMGLSAARDLILDGVNLDFDTTEIDATLGQLSTRLSTNEMTTAMLTASVADFTTRLETAESTVRQFNGRTTTIEDNVANLYMQLSAERELGLQPNLLLVEDFVDNKCCDMQSFKVTAALNPDGTAWTPPEDPIVEPEEPTTIPPDEDEVTTSDPIDESTTTEPVSEETGTWLIVENAFDVRPGRWYTITDGTNAELVQVRTVYHAADGEYRVRLDTDLTKAYDMTNTRFCRTTGTIQNGVITGAGEIRSQAIPFTETWQGTGTNAQVTLTLTMTQANSNSFTVTDSGTFSADGEFTLSD